MLIAAHTAPHPARHALQSRSLPFCRSRRFERPHVQVVCDFVGKTRRAYLQERKAVGACKSRAAAAKAVEDEIAAAGAVPDGVGYERDRLDRGVHIWRVLGCFQTCGGHTRKASSSSRPDQRSVVGADAAHRPPQRPG